MSNDEIRTKAVTTTSPTDSLGSRQSRYTGNGQKKSNGIVIEEINETEENNENQCGPISLWLGFFFFFFSSWKETKTQHYPRSIRAIQG